MNSKKTIGILLIIGSLVLGYFGFTKIDKSGASVEVFGLEIDASNESEKQQGYMLLGLSVVMFIGGIYTSGKK